MTTTTTMSANNEEPAIRSRWEHQASELASERRTPVDLVDCRYATSIAKFIVAYSGTIIDVVS